MSIKPTLNTGRAGTIPDVCKTPTYGEWMPYPDVVPLEHKQYLTLSHINWYHGGCWDRNGVPERRNAPDLRTSLSMRLAFYYGPDNHRYDSFDLFCIAWTELPDVKSELWHKPEDTPANGTHVLALLDGCSGYEGFQIPYYIGMWNMWKVIKWCPLPDIPDIYVQKNLALLAQKGFYW